MVAIGLGACLTGCGSPAHTAGAPLAPAPRPPARMRARVVGKLPRPVQLPAAASLPSAATLLLGGLGSQDESLPTAVRVSRGRTTLLRPLPAALHDAAAAALGGEAYLFGGGGPAGALDGILRVGRSGRTASVGRLLTPSSDLGAATVGGAV